MRENLICRYHSPSQVQHNERRSFIMPGATPHYAPDRLIQLEHILLNLHVNPFKKTLFGTIMQRLKVIVPGQKFLRLDQKDLIITEVKKGNTIIPFSLSEGECMISFHQPLQQGEEFELYIQYQIQNPKKGIYFTGPDENYPHKPYQVWTQGQDEESRYWFPTLDYPNQKITSEVIVTVPEGFTAISNGALISNEKVKGPNQEKSTRFHYSLRTRHVTYLITLVIGNFIKHTESGPNQLLIEYFVSPEHKDNIKRSFGNTPKMIEVFEKKIGLPYPYEKYSQIAVQDFIFGGMENTSATTQTDMTLHDERAHLDFSSDELVAHELAHQWFGNWVTCRDWSHSWLNEGFATFMERVWIENNPELHQAKDEAQYSSWIDWKEYINEDEKCYRRPLVCNTYIEPIHLFDAHLYQKGGLVLNLIRSTLGEELFWKSINQYVSQYREKNVETLDLIRAIEESTGRNLRKLFDQWVFQSGYPELELTCSWNPSSNQLECTLEQKQSEMLFHLSTQIELTFEDRTKKKFEIELKDQKERFVFSAITQPMMLRFDPDASLPKKLKLFVPKEMLLFQLVNSENAMGRIEAIHNLSTHPSADNLITINALGKCLMEDCFWGAQVEAAKALGTIRSHSARDWLIEGLSLQHPKARRAAVQALGTFLDEKASNALLKIAQRDTSYFVEADAITAWAITKNNPLTRGLESQSFQEEKLFLFEKLKVNSYREVIRSAALTGLSEFWCMFQEEAILNTIIEWTRKGKPLDARLAAIRGLGRILKEANKSLKNKLIQIFKQLSDEQSFRLRMQMLHTLEQADISEVIPIIEKIKFSDSDGRIKRLAAFALNNLMSSHTVPESLTQLKIAFQKLEENYFNLKVNKITE